MSFKEWLESLTVKNPQTAGEDLGDSIVLIAIMVILMYAAFK